MSTQLNEDEIERRSTEFYERELRATLEVAHLHDFVAIEPVSETWYVGNTFREAARKARLACPGKISFTIRIGHKAALYFAGIEG